MFDNIGAKIKMLAKVQCWIGIAVSVIGGLVLAFVLSYYSSGPFGFLIGFPVAVLGSILSWAGSLTLCGFGQLVINSDIMTEQSRRAGEKSDEQENYQKSGDM